MAQALRRLRRLAADRPFIAGATVGLVLAIVASASGEPFGLAIAALALALALALRGPRGHDVVPASIGGGILIAGAARVASGAAGGVAPIEVDLDCSVLALALMLLAAVARGRWARRLGLFAGALAGALAAVALAGVAIETPLDRPVGGAAAAALAVLTVVISLAFQTTLSKASSDPNAASAEIEWTAAATLVTIAAIMGIGGLTIVRLQSAEQRQIALRHFVALDARETARAVTRADARLRAAVTALLDAGVDPRRGAGIRALAALATPEEAFRPIAAGTTHRAALVSHPTLAIAAGRLVLHDEIRFGARPNERLTFSRTFDRNAPPFAYPGSANRISICTADRSACATNSDERPARSLVQTAPIPGTGLVVVGERVAMLEIAPLVKQFERFGILVAIVIALGLLLLRLRLRPLVDSLRSSRTAESLSNGRFAAAANGSLDGLYLARSLRDAAGAIVDFTFTFVNGEGARLLEMPADRIVGARLCDVLPEMRSLGLFDRYVDVVERGTAIDEEIPIPPESAVVATHVHHQIVRCNDGIAITARDISARKRQEQLLAQSIRLRTAIVESAACAIVSYDLEGKITSANPTAGAMFGCSEAELLASDYGALLGERERDDDERVVDGETTMRRGDGSTFPAKLSTSPLRDDDGRVYGYLGIAYDITRERSAAESLAYSASHDALTGLPNRGLLERRISVALERARADGGSLSLLLVDLDHFKRVNDSLGHHVGDQVLQVTAARLAACTRSADLLARMGGDEFLVVLPTASSAAGCEVVAQKILEVLAMPIEIDGLDLVVTPSLGISSYPADGDDLAALLRNADAALYRAKALGRNAYEIYDAELAGVSARRFVVERRLRQALERSEFDLAFQPQIDLRSRTVIGVEALLRLGNEDGSALSPAEFIPVAEDTGLIVSIGRWVLAAACARGAWLQRELGRPIRIAVNVSPRQFREKNLAETVEAALRASGLAPSSLEIEITEGVLMDSGESSARCLRQLRALGCSVAVDDFGTGYSSLGYLRRYEVDRLKVDRSFVRDVADDPADAALAAAVIGLARNLSLSVVAEGVETDEQLAFLQLHRCDEAQGYLFARPMPIEAVPGFVEELGLGAGEPTLPEFLGA